MTTDTKIVTLSYACTEFIEVSKCNYFIEVSKYRSAQKGLYFLRQHKPPQTDTVCLSRKRGNPYFSKQAQTDITVFNSNPRKYK